ncbi:MAG: hypothetical protein U0746_15210 [Gemmataceae bacterium]
MRSAVGIVLECAAAAFAGGCAAWLLAHYAIVTGRVFQRFWCGMCPSRMSAFLDHRRGDQCGIVVFTHRN